MGYFDRLDFTTDLEVMQGLDTMTLKVEGSADIVLDNCVVSEPIDTHEMEPSDGQVPQMDSLFVWPVYRSPAKPPLGSVLVDADDVYWTLLTVRRKQHVETWECHGRNLEVLPGVYNTITALKAVFGKGQANEAKPDWRGLVSGKRTPTAEDQFTARIQPATEDAVLRFDAEWTKQAARIILDTPLRLDMANGEFRILSATGERYRILRYFDPQRIDRKSVIFAIKILEGAEYVSTPLPAPEFPTKS
jgi:hypothetical protein